MALRSNTIRIAVVLSSVLIGTILVIQVFWLKKVYELEQRVFNSKVMRVIEGYYESSGDTIFSSTDHLSKLVNHPEPFVYIARLGQFPDTNQIMHILREQFTQNEIFTICGVSLQMEGEKEVRFREVIPSANAARQTIDTWPKNETPYGHLGLYFPNRNKYVLLQINFWVISIIALLAFIILFSVGVYLIFRQRFLHELQKDFIHQLTHEFKTPVSVLTLASDVLQKPEIANQPQKLATYADIVGQQTRYLGNQLERLVLLAFTDSKGIELKKERILVEPLIQRAVDSLHPLIEQKKARIIWELKGTQPEIKADPDYLFTVIVNLVDNALKYAKDPEIKINTRSDERWFYLMVEDNGIGMEKTQWKRIFRKFYRINTGDAHEAEGMGIGLSFVKMIVDAHKGQIQILSKPGKGSLFTITLPLD
ncbi:MAG: HAMP domain-containing histidine kinase [Chitinophagaceae bacterium]|nr:HAMP domain-containing histidine kinase [Chitinophagaceae bacterium]